MTRLSAVVLISVLGCVTEGIAQDEQRTMRVRVVNEAQEPLPEAAIHASIWSPDPAKANRDYVTDKDGWATVELPDRIRIDSKRFAKGGSTFFGSSTGAALASI